MFKIAVNPSYTTTVKVDIPTDNGKTMQRAFQAKFKRLSQTELDDLSDRLKSGLLNDSAMISEVMIGWDGVHDEQGTALEFNEQNLAALLDVFPVRPSIVKTFFTTIDGAKAKN